MKKNLTIIELAWLAGILEGDGCFSINININNATPTISLQMTDQDIVDKVSNMLESTCYCREPILTQKKTTFTTCITGNKAISMMKKLLPFMGTRRSEKIKHILYQDDEVRPGTPFGERQGSSKLTDKQAIEIKERYLRRKENGETGASIAKEFHVTIACVHYTAHHRRFATKLEKHIKEQLPLL